MEFVDPRSPNADPADPYELSIELSADADAGQITIGLLANGFPDSVAFLDHVETALGQRLPEVRFARYDKGNASIVAPDAMLDEITERCDAVVAAYGH